MTNYEKYKKLSEKVSAISFAMRHINWDAETEAPPSSLQGRGLTMRTLTTMMQEIVRSEEYVNTIKDLHKEMDSLDDFQKREVEEEYKGIQVREYVPEKLSIEMSSITNEAVAKWTEAREKKDFSIFKPYLEKLIAYKKEYSKCLENKFGYETDYDCHMDIFERGAKLADYDALFAVVKKDLVPFIKKVLDKNVKYNDSFLDMKFEKEKQKEFAEYLISVLPYDYDNGVMKESAHPFTWGTSSDDVRFTVRYLEDLPFSSILAAAHEMGHAIHFQGVDKKYSRTAISQVPSMVIGESQSRFYENHIGLNKVFWKKHYPKLQETFERQLKGVSLDDFYKVLNKVEPSFIRVEADELTYPIHVLIRYEIEKEIFFNNISVDELPALWNSKIEEYLGIVPKDDSEGILQDIHWSFGAFGYFPTYAMGSALSAQIENKMKEVMDIDKCIETDDYDTINNWLKENIHKFGGFKLPNDVIKDALGEEFNPKYYIDYLIKKYTKVLLED